MSEKTCPNCGEPFTDGMRFCRKCGTTLMPPTSAAPVLGGNLEAHPEHLPVNNDESTIVEPTEIVKPTEIPVAQPIAAPAPRKGGVFWMIGFFVLLTASLVLAGFLFKSCKDSDSMSSSMQYDNDRLREQVARLTGELETAEDAAQSARDEVADLTRMKNVVAAQIPFVITDFKIENVDYNGNVETPAGSTIYSSSTMYLRPKITYYGIKSGTQTLYFKLYTPSGSMSTGTGSPSGYSYSESMTVNTGGDNEATFKGWGGNDRGHWSSGTYRFEIWCGDVCLKSKRFTIY